MFNRNHGLICFLALAVLTGCSDNSGIRGHRNPATVQVVAQLAKADPLCDQVVGSFIFGGRLFSDSEVCDQVTQTKCVMTTYNSLYCYVKSQEPLPPNINPFSYAQSVTIRVVNSDNVYLTGARADLRDATTGMGYSAYSDRDGNAVFLTGTVKYGTYELSVSYTGYATNKKTLVVNNVTVFDWVTLTRDNPTDPCQFMPPKTEPSSNIQVPVACPSGYVGQAYEIWEGIQHKVCRLGAYVDDGSPEKVTYKGTDTSGCSVPSPTDSCASKPPRWVDVSTEVRVPTACPADRPSGTAYNVYNGKQHEVCAFGNYIPDGDPVARDFLRLETSGCYLQNPPPGCNFTSESACESASGVECDPDTANLGCYIPRGSSTGSGGTPPPPPPSGGVSCNGGSFASMQNGWASENECRSKVAEAGSPAQCYLENGCYIAR